MFRKLKAGNTSQSVPLFVKDTSKTDGSGLGSLVFNTSGLAAKYRRQGDNTWTTITLQTMTVGTWATGGFIADGGPVTGGYEFGIPNAVLASAAGVTWAEVMIYGATNMLPVLFFFELDAVDYQDAVHFGMSALPNTACTSNASLITSGSGTDQLTVSGGIASSDAKKINAVSTSNVTTINANVGTTQPTNYTGTGASALVKSDTEDWGGGALPTIPSAGTIATTVWQDLTASADFTTAGSIGKLLATDIDAAISSRYSGTPPTTAAIATAVWQDLTASSDFSTAGSIGALLKTYVVSPTTSAIATAVWQDLTASADFTTVGSIGKLLVTDIDATISSRLATSGYTAPDNADIATIVATTNRFLFDGNSYVKANAETVSDKTGYTLTVTPPTAAQVATAVWTDLTAGSDFQTAGSVGAFVLTLSGGGGGNVTVGGYANGEDPATLVWNAVASNFNTAGTMGNKLNAAGGAADPLGNYVPGNYLPGTAGNAIGLLLGANVKVFAPVAANGDTTITRGDDYLAADSRALLYSDTGNTWADNSTAVWKIFRPGSSTPTLSVAGTISPATGSGKQLTVALSSAVTAALTDTTYRLAVVFTRQDGHVETNIAGTLTVNP